MTVALRRYPEEEQWPSFSNTASEFVPAVARPVMISRPQALQRTNHRGAQLALGSHYDRSFNGSRFFER